MSDRPQGSPEQESEAKVPEGAEAKNPAEQAAKDSLPTEQRAKGAAAQQESK